MKRAKSIGLWLLATAIMFGAAAYQRTTGPTYPLSGTLQDGQSYLVKVSAPGYAANRFGACGF